MVGTLIYMAPEVMRKEIHTEKSDVYSFGITVNELLTGIVPYTDLQAETQAHTVLEMNYTQQQLTAAIVSEGLRPVLAELQSSAPASLVSLIEGCWDKDQQNRPSFDDIVVELDSILEHEIGRNCMENASGEAFISLNDVDAANFQSYQENISWFSQGKNFLKRVPTALAASTWLDSSDDHIYSPVLSWGYFASCGRRETMKIDTSLCLSCMMKMMFTSLQSLMVIEVQRVSTTWMEVVMNTMGTKIGNFGQQGNGEATIQERDDGGGKNLRRK